MSESAVMSEFCKQLKAFIESTGMTVSAAADAAGIDKGNFSRILNGKERVTLDRAERIANALGAEVSIKVVKLRKMSAA
jgi:transcriptional regulator with XRE-family HTH domain